MKNLLNITLEDIQRYDLNHDKLVILDYIRVVAPQQHKGASALSSKIKEDLPILNLSKESIKAALKELEQDKRNKVNLVSINGY